MKRINVMTISTLVLTVMIAAISTQPVARPEAKCAMPAFEAEFERSQAVFIGEVTKVRKEGDKRYFVLEVKQFWKGVSGKKLELAISETPRFQAHFEEGKTYLIFAKKNEEDGTFFDVRCSRSAEIGGYSNTWKRDLAALGEAKTCISLDQTGEEIEIEG